MSTPSNLLEAFENEDLKNIISDTIEAANELGIDFFGVGALARNVWYVENDLEPRGTKDVDFGVYIPNSEIYSALKTKLIKDYKYVQSSGNAFCLISPNNIPVDFLPFGEIENQGKVLIDGKGLTTIKLDGFKEVYDNGVRTVDIGPHTINICTIPSVILLKLIAYDDRPEHRSKDPFDISSIFKEFPNIESDLLWEKYSYLYDQDISHEEIGTIVLGCEVYKLISQNKELLNRVLNILQNALELNSSLAERMIIDNENETVEQKLHLLRLFKKGIENEMNNAS
jgi:predicted nucleotidyltransferase